MTEGRHHRRRDDDDHTADGIYVPPPREVPRPRSEPAGPPPPPLSPWAPSVPGGSDGPPPPAAAAGPSTGGGRPSPWAPTTGDEFAEEPPEEPEAEQAPPAQDRWLAPLYPQEWPPEPARREWTPLAAPEPRDATPPPGAPERSSATAWWIAIGVIIVALAVAAGVLVGLSLAARGGEGSTGAAAATCRGRPVMRATVAPELAPAVEQAAGDIGANPAGGCKLVVVTAQETFKEGEAWVPASTAWAGLARFGAAPSPVSLARTPVVLAVPRPFAESLGWPAKQPTWAGLAAAVNAGQVPRLSMSSPLSDTAGLLAALEVQAAMANTTKDPGIAQMRALAVRARVADADVSPGRLLERMAGQTDPGAALREVGAFPITERELWPYLQGQHKVQLAALYPSDALLEADYPLLLTPKAGQNGDLTALAARLAERMHAKDFAAALTARGLRPALGSADAGAAPGAPGLATGYVAADLPDGAAAWASTWAQYRRLVYNTLLLVDASASMNDEVHDRSGATTTKAGLLRSAGVQAAQLFGDETSLGVWMFASPGPEAPPFTVALPFGPMSEKIGDTPRREAMRKVAEGYQAYPKAGTPLFETVLRGFQDMQQRYQSGAVNMVVVLTDGKDQDSRYSMPKEDFINRLTATRDPAKPVMIFAIGYGGDADLAVLREMAQLTGGQAVASNDPGDLASAMAKIFLAAHAPR